MIITEFLVKNLDLPLIFGYLFFVLVFKLKSFYFVFEVFFFIERLK